MSGVETNWMWVRPKYFFSDQIPVFFPNKGGLRQLFSFSSALMDYAYGYPAMDKRRAPGRPSLQDYLKLAALQFELDSEEAENEIVPNEGMKMNMKSIFNWQKALHTFHLLIIFAFFWYFF